MSGDMLDTRVRRFVKSAALQLHDVNGHVRWDGNRPTSEPFDWTTNCQHVDCRMVREWLSTPADETPKETR